MAGLRTRRWAGENQEYRVLPDETNINLWAVKQISTGAWVLAGVDRFTAEQKAEELNADSPAAPPDQAA